MLNDVNATLETVHIPNRLNKQLIQTIRCYFGTYSNIKMLLWNG